MSSSTSSFNVDKSGVRRFLIRCVLFCLPFFAIWLPLEIFLWKTGESRSAASILELQANSDEEVLYGRGLLNQQFNVYKVAGWRKFKPKIVAVGSSRVWRMRKYAFHPREDDFYNAGGILQCAGDFCALSKLIVEQELPKPEAIIVGFDPWWFKANHRNIHWLDKYSLKDDAYRLASRRSAIKRIVKDPSLLRWSVSDPNAETHTGLFGEIGFRLDGTKKIAATVIESFLANPVYVDREDPPVIDRIRERTGRFSDSAGSEEVLSASVAAMEAIRNEGVRVIAYFPPFADESWNAMEQSEPIKQWMTFYQGQVVPSLSSAADEVIALGTSSSLGVDDTYFLDGMHPGEVLATLQWIDLVEQHQSDAFYQQFAPMHIRQQIEQRCSTPLAYDE